MSHLVKPISFRVGKTQIWRHNSLLGNKPLVSSDLLLTKGITQLNKALLRRKRLYVINGAIVDSSFSKITYNLMYAPRIKTKPREHSVGTFLRRSIYKPFNWVAESSTIKSYVNRRKDKIAKIRKRYKPKKLNRWLTRRMFRGAGKIVWRRRRNINYLHLDYSRILFRSAELFRHAPESIHNNLHHNTVSNSWFQQLCRGDRSVIDSLRQVQPKYALSTNRRQKWRFDAVKSRRFNNKRFSAVVSRILHRRVKISALNIFSYLVSKNALNYKSHQNHFWNFTYRRYRFQYKNYFDIVNAFLVMGLVDNTEGFLLSILRLTLPLILKIRRFFKFLNAVIKNMPELEDKFSVLKLHIAGKLAGGTKRTKSHSIGYGTLPVQTLGIIASNNFLHYRHIYGEFGLKLVMCKNITYKSPIMLA